jgi:CheY-like chemotaxis protein
MEGNMQIIFKNAEERFLRVLNSTVFFNSNLRCIHFKATSKKHLSVQNIKYIAELTESLMFSNACSIYCCRDGEVFLISKNLSYNLSKRLLKNFREQLGLEASSMKAYFTELVHDKDKLKKIVESKLDNIQANSEITSQVSLTDDKIDFEDFTSTISKSITKKKAGRIQKSLLVVDDDAVTRKLVQITLSDSYQLYFASDGSDAITKLVRHAPDAVLLDIGLPDMSGHEVMERIRILDPLINIVMLTSRSECSEVLYSINNGAKGYVTKPFNEKKLASHIEGVLINID